MNKVFHRLNTAVIKFFSGLFMVFCTLLFVANITSCATDEDIDEPGDSNLDEETLLLNEWMNSTMKEVYFWNNRIPSSLNYKTEADPKEFFEKMLYRDEDQWSSFTDNWSAYLKEMEGSPVSMGYSPAFMKVSGSDDVFIVVKYVYKNSPADKAGLKRGDIILTIDGQKMNGENCYELYAGTSYVVGIGKYNAEAGTVVSAGQSVSLDAAEFKANPIIHYEVKEIEGKRIGYLVYASFTSGVNDEFHTSIDKTVTYFKGQSITDLIVDLRYNPGGEMGNVAYLASSLAPKEVVLDKKVLTRMSYNRNIQDYFQISNKDSARLAYYFYDNESNLNLNKITFLSARGTAAASELLIAGMKPYMQVTMVGDSTSGKYVGSWIIPDSSEEPRHDWCLFPVVLRYSNANGFSNFKEGLIPDFYVADQLLPAFPFGDLQDPVFAKAVTEITGVAPAVAKSARLKKVQGSEIFPVQMERKKRLFFPADEAICGF